MKQRRSLEREGISPVKVVGALLFRLSRYRILHLSPDVVDIPCMRDLQSSVALYVACQYLGVNGVLSSAWLKEIQQKGRVGRQYYTLPVKEVLYQLTDRHANQEGLVAWLETVVLLQALYDDYQAALSPPPPAA